MLMLTKKMLSAFSGVVSVLVLTTYSLMAQAALPYQVPYVKQANLVMYYWLDEFGNATGKGNDSFSFSGYLPYYDNGTAIDYCSNTASVETNATMAIYLYDPMGGGVMNVGPPRVNLPPFLPGNWVDADLTFPGFSWANPTNRDAPNNTRCRFSIVPYPYAGIYDVYIERVLSGKVVGGIQPDSYVYVSVTVGKKGSDSAIRFLWRNEWNTNFGIRGPYWLAPYPNDYKNLSLGVYFHNFGRGKNGFFLDHEVKAPIDPKTGLPKPVNNLICDYSPGANNTLPPFSVPQTRVKLCENF